MVPNNPFNTSISDMKNEEEKDIKNNNNNEVNKSDSCKEYQALKYKTMITTGNNIENIIVNETDEDHLNRFLQAEMENNKKQSWNKLSKTEKIKKIKNFLNHTAKSKHMLTHEELASANRFIMTQLQRKKMQKNNELNYNEETGEIDEIYVFVFNENTRKYTLNKTHNSSQTKRSAKNTNMSKQKKDNKTITKKSKIVN